MNIFLSKLKKILYQSFENTMFLKPESIVFNLNNELALFQIFKEIDLNQN